ncbi:MAG: glycoside hydrolase [Rikenellaceae bacterium]|nr:glycoside hydrolase [Rikenellaceae bacterium]
MKRWLFLLIAVSLLSVACSKREAQIITTAESIADGDWQCFHKEFVVLAPKSASLKIAADTKYWLWVNGELIVREGGLKRGPTPTDSYCDILTEVPNLKFGKNDVVVLVQYYGRSSFSHRVTATPGLYFDLSTTLDHVVSDSSWRAIRYDAMWQPPMEHNLQGYRKYRLAGANVGYDARKALNLSQNIDSDTWAEAVVVARERSDWGYFVERPIPQWRWSELRDYESITTKDGAIVGKLPYNLHATPYLKIRAKGGERIKMCTDDYWIGRARSFYTEYIAREGEQEFESPIWTNGHEVLYYVPEGVEVLEVKYRESGYDSDFVGSFECDNDFCNKLWEKAKRTLYVNMRDTYMDCPDRERAQWWGDVVVELGQAGYVFDERAHLLTRKAIYELMMHQREDGTIYSPIPGWYGRELPCQMLAAVGYYGFYTYYLQTGDATVLNDVYDGVKRYLFEVWNRSNHELVELRKGGWFWGDWGSNIDQSALQQCWYALAMQGFAEQARLTGHESDAIYAEHKCDILNYAFNQKYWNEELRQYRTPDYKEMPDDRVQAMAVLAGMVPQTRYEDMRKFFAKHHQSSPYMEKYVLEALCKMGYYEDALKRMEKRFGEMVAAPYSTLWEGWEYTGGRGMKYKSGHGTYNHSWSGGGLTILSQYIAGIAPIEPAFSKFSVEPNLATLRYVKSVVPTRFGNIEMYAKKGSGELNINLVVPQNTEAEVRLPQGYSSLECGKMSGRVLTLSAGKYEIVVR